jgi:hypothetical protein
MPSVNRAPLPLAAILLVMTAAVGCSTLPTPNGPAASASCHYDRKGRCLTVQISAGPHRDPTPGESRPQYDDETIRELLAEQATTTWLPWVAEQKRKGLDCIPRPEIGFVASCTGSATVPWAIPYDKDPARSQRRAEEFTKYVNEHGSDQQKDAVTLVHAVVGDWEPHDDKGNQHITIHTRMTGYNDDESFQRAYALIAACEEWQRGRHGVVVVSNVTGHGITYKDTSVPS